MMKFTKVDAGWYANADGTVAVISDGYKPVAQRDRDGAGVAAGITGSEWAVVTDDDGRMRREHNAGETHDWFSTKRDAIAFAQRFEQTSA
jgi:hypothetical protein